MTEAVPPPVSLPMPPGLRRRRAMTRAVLIFERLWVLLWPALGAAGLYLCLALLGVPQRLPAVWHAVSLAGFTLAIVVALARAAWRLRLPSPEEVDRRLERTSGLAHRPLAVLADRPALPGGEALWQAHLTRVIAELGRLRVGAPHPGLAAQDRRGLRGALVVGLAAALVVAGGEAPRRVAAALWPHFPPGPAAPPPLVQAWITPPAYTHLPPMLLTSEQTAVTVPAGSHLAVSVSGGSGLAGSGVPVLALDHETAAFRALDAASFIAERDLVSGGRLLVRRHGWQIAAWDLTVLAPRPPVASWNGTPGKAARGNALRLPWQVSDVYGVTALATEMRLAERPDAPPLRLSIPLPGLEPKAAHGVATQDLTAHPWAGLAVTARLAAQNGAGLAGKSEPARIILPARTFHNRMAQALVHVRQMLALQPDDRPPVLVELDRLSFSPEAIAPSGPFAADIGAFLNLRAVAALLQRDLSDAAVGEAQTRLWQLALHFEEGSATRTAKALDAALRAAREGLDAAQKARPPTPPEPDKAQAAPKSTQGQERDQAELDRKLGELERTLAQHLQALTEQARRNAADPKALQQDARALERMAQALRQAARENKTQSAREQLKALEQRLAQLRKPQSERQRQAAEQRQRAGQQTSALQDLVQREAGLLDHAQKRDRPAEPDSQEPERREPDAAELGMPAAPRPPDGGMAGGGQPGRSPSPADSARQSDARTEQALRHALGELVQQLGDLTGEVPKSFGEADQDMEQASQALGEGRDAVARAAEQRAIAALQQGGREMAQAMQRRDGGQQQGQEEGDQSDSESGFGQNGSQSQDDGGSSASGQGLEGRERAHLDPLGRRVEEGTSGDAESSDVKVPDEMEQVRSRSIEEELRRRAAERARPVEELDYIERLLRQF